MSEESSARVRSAVPVRVLRSLLLAAALVCALALSPAGRAGALRPAAGLAAATPSRDAGRGVIAFEADGDIYVADVGGGSPSKIVDSHVVGGINMQPALSPDASRVAFSGEREGKFSIYLVGVDGAGLRRLTHGNDDDTEPAWSPDGSRIAFVRGFDATGSGVVIVTCERSGDILIVSTDEVADGMRPVETKLTGDWGGTDPAWSPDGKRIAFASERAGTFDIYTMSSEDGQDVRRLTHSNSAEADPSWSPDGNWIAYTGRLYQVWGGTQCGNMPIIGGPTGGNGDPDCGEDGVCDDEEDSVRGSFTWGSGPYIYRMAADGSKKKNLTDTGGAAEPVWSPDGSQIAFVGGRKGDDVDVYLISWDGIGPLVHFTSDSVEESSPSWAGTPVR